MKAQFPILIIFQILLVLLGRPTCHAQMFQTAKPLPSASEAKVYNAGAGGYKTGSATQVIEKAKDGVSKVYNAGPSGYKTGSPTQVIETGKDGVTKIYNAGAGGYKTGSPVQVIEPKR